MLAGSEAETSSLPILKSLPLDYFLFFIYHLKELMNKPSTIKKTAYPDTFFEVPQKIHKHRLGYYWLILSFQAGAINTGAIILFGSSVSHVTGIGTSSGIDFAGGEWKLALTISTIPIFFLLGNILTTFLKIKNYKKSFYKAQEQCFSIMLFVFILIFLLEISGTKDFYGENALVYEKYQILMLLSFACGMQNAIFNGLVKGVIRSTHLTGTTTDLGVDIGKLLFSPKEMDTQDRSLAICRALSIVFFVLGALVSSYFYLSWNILGFLIPCLTMFGLLINVRSLRKRT